MRRLTANCTSSSILPALLFLAVVSPKFVTAQSGGVIHGESSQSWDGRRIVTLKGFGDYFVSDDHGQPQLVRPEGLGVNIVAVAARLEGDRVWVRANGVGEAPIGWVEKGNVILLDDAIPYFTGLIEHNPKDWDAYLRRAESEHALNQRDAAIADYTRAIELHPDESFLFVRRGRQWSTMKSCSHAAEDFDKAAHLRPEWPEPYNLAAGVYANCSDRSYRDPAKAIALINQAIALDIEHPTYLTVLALAYFRSGELEKAVATQRQALESPRFPPAYREEATTQLRQYEQALAAHTH